MNVYCTSFVSIFLSIIVISISPSSSSSSSLGHKLTDTEIKQLCSKTGNLESCYKILKSDHRTSNVDARGLAEVSIDLASKKANQIHSELNSMAKATRNSRSRNTYSLCSKNYNDIIRDLEAAKNKLKLGAYNDIPIQVKDASEENKNCEQVFHGGPIDRAHLKKKINDVQLMLSIVTVMTNNLNKK